MRTKDEFGFAKRGQEEPEAQSIPRERKMTLFVERRRERRLRLEAKTKTETETGSREQGAIGREREMR